MQPSALSSRGLGVLSHVAAFALSAILLAAPFFYACTRPEPLRLLTLGMHAVTFLWILAFAWERRKPALPKLALLAASAFVAYIWLWYCFGEPAAIAPFTQEHFTRAYARWPESMILRTPLAIAGVSSSMTLCLVIVADLSQQRNWRKVFAATMVVGGVGVVALGFWQNYAHVQGIYDQPVVRSMPSRFFGPFYHFTSAGAFINATWPLAASLALTTLLRSKHGAGRWFAFLAWTAAAIFVLAGHAGHVSRFPQVLAVGALALLFFLHRPVHPAQISLRKIAPFLGAGIAMVAVVLWLISHAGRQDAITARWKMLQLFPTPSATVEAYPAPETWPRLMRDDLFIPVDHSHYFLQDRGAAYSLALHCIAARPFLGFGPGGWMAAASQYSRDPQLRTFFHYLQFTHEDYLQTLVEWGLVGGLLCAVLVFGGLAHAIKALSRFRSERRASSSSQAIVIGAVAALAAILAQSLIDFPLQIPVNALYACALLGICWARDLPQPNRQISV